MTLPLFLEVHVDDELLSGDPARWDEAAALLDALARRAEDAGGVLCFRVRPDFARGDDRRRCGGLLRALQLRGHEIGWHAHGRGLGAAVRALEDAGVSDAARVGAPGLVQVDQASGWRARLTPLRARAVLERAWALGLRVLTDRRAHRHFGWQGRVPWTIELGGGRTLTSVDVSADPFAWGVLSRAAGGVAHARGTLDWTALDAAIARREAELRLPGSYFGATLHEHNLCAPGSLTPLPAAMDAYARWLDRRGPQLRRAADLAADAVRPGPPAASPDRHRRLGLRLQRARGEARDIPVGDRVVRSLWFPAERPRGYVVAVHGGAGGCTQRLGFLGLPDGALAARGWTLIVFDRTPGVPRTPGEPTHVADTAAVIATARAAAGALPLHVLTWSGGVVPAVAGDLRGVARLVDVEGPADRYALVPPGRTAHELARAEIGDDAAWAGREALEGIARLVAGGGAYVRVQGAPDHVHGAVDLHARTAMHAASPHGRLVRLPGPVHRHGADVLDAVTG